LIVFIGAFLVALIAFSSILNSTEKMPTTSVHKWLYGLPRKGGFVVLKVILNQGVIKNYIQLINATFRKGYDNAAAHR
jgi:hypothetical protein